MLIDSEIQSNLVIYKDSAGQFAVDVKLEDETVWLSQKQMAQLFNKDLRTISEHISNIYKENELEINPTIRNFRIVQTEGKRRVSRDLDFYNLDVIISVGYRVKSKEGT